MNNVYCFHGIIFDDYVKEKVSSTEVVWSQVCKDCIKKYNIEQMEKDGLCSLDEDGSGICGVEDCWNDADVSYIDFIK